MLPPLATDGPGTRVAYGPIKTDQYTVIGQQQNLKYYTHLLMISMIGTNEYLLI